MKTPIKRLDSLSHNDSAATKLINDNFAALQQGIEDSLSRTGKTPNFMDAELDMNSRRIINTGEPVDDTDAVNYGAYKKHIDKAISSAQNAAISANNAKNSAIEAKQAARQARDARDEAVASLDEINRVADEGIMDITELVDNGKADLNKIIVDGKESLGDFYTKEEVDAIKSERFDLVSFPENWYERASYDGEFKYMTGHSLWNDTGAVAFSGAVLTFSEADAISGNFSPVFSWDQSTDQGLRRINVEIFAKEIPDHDIQYSITFIH